MPYYRSDQLPLIEILSSNVTYFIPNYQRKYVWVKRNWEELYDDICEYSRLDHPHFLGHVVFSSGSNETESRIVDGQQRLVTLSLLIAAISNEYYRRGKNQEAERVRRIYLFNYDQPRIRKDDSKTLFLETIIDELSEYRTKDDIERIYKSSAFLKTDIFNLSQQECFLYFSERVKESADLKKLLSLILKSEVIRIKVQEEVEGYGIFETLNARGIPLQDQELLKNFIYRYMPNVTKKNKIFDGCYKLQNIPKLF